MRKLPEHLKVVRRGIETHLTDQDMRALKIMAVELGAHTITLTTALIRAGLDPDNREYVEELVKAAQAQSQVRDLAAARQRQRA